MKSEERSAFWRIEKIKKIESKEQKCIFLDIKIYTNYYSARDIFKSVCFLKSFYVRNHTKISKVDILHLSTSRSSPSKAANSHHNSTSFHIPHVRSFSILRNVFFLLIIISCVYKSILHYDIIFILQKCTYKNILLNIKRRFQNNIFPHQ